MVKSFMGDTETTTEKYSKTETKVWAWAFCEIGDEDNLSYGNNIDSLMNAMFNNLGNWYFHNLKWDGSFIVSWLLSNGYKFNGGTYAKPGTFKGIISETNQWYSIDICVGRKGKHVQHIRLLDSYKKLPFPVSAISDAFNIGEHKTSINYDLNPDDSSWLDDHKLKEYVSNDVTIVSKALNIQFNDGMKKMTVGSDALADFKESIGKREYQHLFPALPQPIHVEIKKAYKGGFVWTNPKYAGKNIGKGRVYDTNSMYPSRMAKCMLPYGLPEIFVGKYEEDKMKPLYIQSMTCMFQLKEGHIPTVQDKSVSPNGTPDFLTSSGGEEKLLALSNPDMELLFKHYDVYNINYKGGFKFAGKHGIFTDWINKYMDVKMNATGAIRQLAKLRLNNLYGKFGSSIDVTRKQPFLDSEGKLRFKSMAKEYAEDKYIPMAVFITAWARHYIISTAQRCYDRILYCDTDSIHLKGDTIPTAIAEDIDPVKLGYWKHESTFNRGRFLRPKTYIEDIDGSENFYAKGTKVSYPLYSEQDKTVVDHIYSEPNVDGKKKLLYYILVDKKDNVINAKPNEISHIHIRCAGMQEATRKKVTWDNFIIGFKDETGRKIPEQIKGGIVLHDRTFEIKPNKTKAKN